MRLTSYKDQHIDQQWFIHFTFKSRYDGAEDCSLHDRDYWKGYHNLPAVKACQQAICDGHFASPDEWNYIRPANQVNPEGLHMGKWVKHSPFHNGSWQRFPVDIDQE